MPSRADRGTVAADCARCTEARCRIFGCLLATMADRIDFRYQDIIVIVVEVVVVVFVVVIVIRRVSAGLTMASFVRGLDVPLPVRLYGDGFQTFGCFCKDIPHISIYKLVDRAMQGGRDHNVLVNSQLIESCGFVTNRAQPLGALLLKLQIRCSIKALNVSAAQSATGQG